VPWLGDKPTWEGGRMGWPGGGQGVVALGVGGGADQAAVLCMTGGRG
jgi:hypothetical protein